MEIRNYLPLKSLMKNLLFGLTILFCISFTTNKKAETTYQLFVFEGSDWCANCIRLEKKVLNDSSFLHFLSVNHIDLVKVDFPQRKKLTEEQESQNAAIAEKYEFNGAFPTIIFARKDTLSYQTLYYSNQSVNNLQNQISQSKAVLK